MFITSQMALKHSFLFIFFLLGLSACTLLEKEESLVEKADRLRADGLYQDAIQLYREHMTNRMVNPTRQSWENPHFYLLSIGDTYLEEGDPVRALQNYELALNSGVSEKLVTDRILSLASWFEQHDQPEQGIRLLESHKNLDSLLFNAVIDRLNRQIIAAEQAQEDLESQEKEVKQ